MPRSVVVAQDGGVRSAIQLSCICGGRLLSFSLCFARIRSCMYRSNRWWWDIRAAQVLWVCEDVHVLPRRFFYLCSIITHVDIITSLAPLYLLSLQSSSVRMKFVSNTPAPFLPPYTKTFECEITRAIIKTKQNRIFLLHFSLLLRVCSQGPPKCNSAW